MEIDVNWTQIRDYVIWRFSDILKRPQRKGHWTKNETIDMF